MLTPEKITALGYSYPRRLPDGRWIATKRMLFTTGLYVVEDKWGWKTRWCYERTEDAIKAVLEWDGQGDPPGPWLIQKPEQKPGPGMPEYEARTLKDPAHA